MADSYICDKCNCYIGTWGLKDNDFIPTLNYHQRHESVINLTTKSHIRVGRGRTAYCC